MAIYLKDKKITPYRGDYKPVNIYQGAQKIAGWHNEERTGDTAVEWDDTYNDYVGGTFGGRSEQDGTPSPDYPSPIISAQPVLGARGRNLFDWHSVDNLSPNVGYLVDNGDISTRYTAWASALYIWKSYKLLKKGTYTITGDFMMENNGYILDRAWCTVKRSVGETIQQIAFITSPVPTQFHQWVKLTATSFTLVEDSYINITLQSPTGSTYANRVHFKNLEIIQGSYTNMTKPPYTPYRAPTTLEFPELRAIALPETAAEWTYIDEDGVKYWADTAVYTGGGWWDVVRRNFKIRWNALSSRRAHDNSNESTTMIIMYETNKFGTYGSTKCLGGFESSYCSHFIYNDSAPSASSTTESYACVWHSNPPYIMVRINNERIGALSTDDLPTRYNKFVAWEAEQAALGKPLTFGICIKEEYATTERVHIGTLKSYPRYTHVEQITDGVRASMQLTAKVVDR